MMKNNLPITLGGVCSKARIICKAFKGYIREPSAFYTLGSSIVLFGFDQILYVSLSTLLNLGVEYSIMDSSLSNRSR